MHNHPATVVSVRSRVLRRQFPRTRESGCKYHDQRPRQSALVNFARHAAERGHAAVGALDFHVVRCNALQREHLRQRAGPGDRKASTKTCHLRDGLDVEQQAVSTHPQIAGKDERARSSAAMNRRVLTVRYDMKILMICEYSGFRRCSSEFRPFLSVVRTAHNQTRADMDSEPTLLTRARICGGGAEQLFRIERKRV